ncbi:MAG: hypothetical protein LBG94_02845 [Treponema sp.]|jgi:hypothetical protein|nr:hypothetical protein [Treponema sp.]
MSNAQKHQKYSRKSRFKNSKIAVLAETLNFRDKAILTGWIAGLLILISLLWTLTQGLQTRYLLRTVNSVFVNSNDTRRITAPLQIKTGKADLLGYWYQMYNSPDIMFVFTIFKDGILIPAGAIVSANNGRVDEIIPLSAHAAQVFDDLPGSILQMYISRIEEVSRGEIE